ncbi:MAG: ATP-binding protein [Rectinemataceae bacterium]
MSDISPSTIQGSLFEEDYLIRTLGSLAHHSDIALTELVANAWDAGASEVRITIPEKSGDRLIVEDNGTGLIPRNFSSRWMKLGYNRIKHQGKKVEFPPGIVGNRLAYGRNGIGRHGLLCFASEYVVTTICAGTMSTYQISTRNNQSPFYISKEEHKENIAGHGLRLEVAIERNKPDPDRLLDVLSARFMHDPSFKVFINGRSIPLEEHKGLIDSKEIAVNDSISIKLLFIDSMEAGRKTLYQGVAFWQGGRLVGEPSWLIGTESVIDGRTRFAKQYTMVVVSEDLGDFVNEDWTGFIKTDQLLPVFDAVRTYANEVFSRLASEQIDSIKADVKREFKQDIASLSALGKYEVDEVIQNIATKYPIARPEILGIAVEAVINLERTRTGVDLLQRIAALSQDDIEGLNRLLSQWSIKDALIVLDEIDKRISTIEAIRKLSEDPKVDELHVLHPLITASRWLFGPEFDSPEYCSNRQLQTVARQLFSRSDKADIFLNSRKRPDLIVLEDCSFGLTGTGAIDTNTGLLSTSNILLVELKRGGFELTRTERSQLQGYIEDLLGSGIIGGNPFIHAFLIGLKVEKGGLSGAKILAPNDPNRELGKMTIASFAQIVDTAENRLFRLRSTLQERYDDMPEVELGDRIQIELGL